MLQIKWQENGKKTLVYGVNYKFIPLVLKTN